MSAFAGFENADMSACVCTECGAAADDAAEQCASCGAPLENRRLHEGSDVRIESERLDAELTAELALASGRWGRASDHPSAVSTVTRVAGVAIAALPKLDDREDNDETAAELALLLHANGAATKSGKSPTGPLAVGSLALERNAQPADATAPVPVAKQNIPNGRPSAELSHLLTHDGVTAAGHEPSPPRPAGNETRPQPSITNTGSHATQTQPQPRRPPVLASEALLRDLAPSRPARRALRVWCPVLGLLGACAAWYLTHGQGMGWPLAGAFAGLALLGLPPMPYPGRASAVATVSGTALALVLWTDAGTPDGLSTVLLTISVTLLAAGLYFRAWHRASVLSRLIVAAGVLSGVAFLWMRGSVADLTVFDTAWQSWVPRLIGLGFGILLMLSLLAFMDARSTGGSAVWAAFVLCWYAAYAAVEILRAAWPKDAEDLDIARIPVDTLLAWTSAPLLTALLGLGLAQLMAAGLAEASSRRSEPFHFGEHQATGFRHRRPSNGLKPS